MAGDASLSWPSGTHSSGHSSLSRAAEPSAQPRAPKGAHRRLSPLPGDPRGKPWQEQLGLVRSLGQGGLCRAREHHSGRGASSTSREAVTASWLPLSTNSNHWLFSFSSLSRRHFLFIQSLHFSNYSKWETNHIPQLEAHFVSN